MSYSISQCQDIVRATNAYETQNGWQGHCPAHDDKNPSFSIDIKDQATKVFCHAGCEFKDIKNALEAQNIKIKSHGNETKSTKIGESRHPYDDLSGKFAYEKVRIEYSDKPKKMLHEPKGFKGQFQPYKYKLWQDRISEIIYIVEGEKCADLLISHGFLATTTGSSTSWKPYHASFFKGRKVVVWPDNDNAGMKYANRVLKDLRGVAQTKLIKPPSELAESEDVYDWFTKGHTNEDFLKLVDGVPWPPENVDTLFDRDTPNTLENVIGAIQKFSKIDIWFDEQSQKLVKFWAGGSIDAWNENDTRELTVALQIELDLKRCTKEMVWDAVQTIAHRNPRNELLDWLKILLHDGIPRIETFLIDCMGAEDNEYVRSVSKNFFIQHVARTASPGCQADHMLILEGAQGAGKSSALRILGGKFYAEITDTPGSKDFALSIRGPALCELSELSVMSKAEVSDFKSAITRTVDHYRPPYGRVSQDFPRRCVFVGTTNEGEYLKDNTGARRFLPIKVGAVNLQKIKDDREQLFAEAFKRYQLKESYWEMPEKTKDEQEARRHEDTWEAAISKWLKEPKDRFDTLERPIRITTVWDILTHCLEIPTLKQNKSEQMRVANALRALGWESFMHDSKRTKHWRQSK